MTAENIGRDLIVVGHAGTIRAALTLALNLPLNSALYYECLKPVVNKDRGI